MIALLSINIYSSRLQPDQNKPSDSATRVFAQSRLESRIKQIEEDMKECAHIIDTYYERTIGEDH